MNKRNWIAMLTLFCVLAGSGELWAKDTEVATEKKVEPAKVEKEAKVKSEKASEGEIELADSYQKIADFADLKGDKLAAFKEAVQKGQEKIDSWKEGKEGQQLIDLRKQLQAARKDKDEAKIKDLETRIEPLNDKSIQLRDSTRAKVLGTLSEKEQHQVVSHSLNNRLLKTLDSANLTEAQQSKIKELAESKIEGYLKEHPLADDPNMRHLIGLQSSLAKQIKSEILTEDQRKALDADKPVKEKAMKEPSKKESTEKEKAN